MDSPWPQIFGGCFVVAALFYAWIKWLNWRDAKPKRIPRHVVRSILKGPLVLALLLPLAGCDTMTPAERAALTSFALDTATMARDKKFGPKAPKAKSGKQIAPTVPPKGTEKLFE